MVGEVVSLEDEDLIEEEDIVITLLTRDISNVWLKTNSVPQKRGGRGVQRDRCER